MLLRYHSICLHNLIESYVFSSQHFACSSSFFFHFAMSERFDYTHEHLSFIPPNLPASHHRDHPLAQLFGMNLG
jgi:hypothetical protein